jgi:hypothetical protein
MMMGEERTNEARQSCAIEAPVGFFRSKALFMQMPYRDAHLIQAVKLAIIRQNITS